MTDIPQEVLRSMWVPGKLEKKEWWAVTCGKKEHKSPWYDKGWKKEDAEAEAREYPYCCYDGTRMKAILYSEEYWQAPYFDHEKERQFLEKYLPELLVGEPNWMKD